MLLEDFSTLKSRTLVLAQENIDTDQIIPARYLTTTLRAGLGKAAFYDWRFDENGKPRKNSPFSGHHPATHQILVGGANFGCGSSREHAPWALTDYGFRAIISTGIADIFKSNALKNSMIPIELPAEHHDALLANPGAELVIDLERCAVEWPGHWTQGFDIDPFGRQCLLDGVDPLGFLQQCENDIAKYEAKYHEL